MSSSCCDGAWNTPDATQNGVPSPTNVVKLHKALAPSDAEGMEQKACYYQGARTTRDGTRRSAAAPARGHGRLAWHSR
ncbi:phospholipase effector Tle1 domain-containing protein [Rhizobium mongolense]|uniref:phospholipase effector Tle1 domain-containing protein n=1 Tax=Rhizobium mongolense TaxID=57676 RepID=UPI003558434B